MKVYVVGGALRDQLLGLPVKDRDYVVVGSTPDEMQAAGFRPVGKDFPVFLHPDTHEEYALARTERKTGKGYKGFQVHASPEVTLEQDLARRDLTINAIAQEVNDSSPAQAVGALIDPHHGVADIRNKTLRHVSAAFAEDPVRILRIARFAARFTDFQVAPDTMLLMQKMVEDGEVDALVAERVWQELAKGLMEALPSRMFMVLRECGALKKILPEIDRLFGVPQPPQHHPEIDTGIHVMMVIDYAAAQGYSLPVRFAALTHDLGKGTTPPEIWPRHIGHEQRSVELLKDLSKRLRVPNDCKELAHIVAKYHGKVHQVYQMRPDTLLNFLQEVDAIRQPERFKRFLKACECDSRGRTGFESKEFPEEAFLLSVLEKAMAVDTASIAAQFSQPEMIKVAVFEARLAAISADGHQIN